MVPSPEWPLADSRAGTGLRRFVGPGRELPAQDETAEAYESCEPAMHAPGVGEKLEGCAGWRWASARVDARSVLTEIRFRERIV